MDDYWRFRPIPDDRQLCPVCSMAHYPFCPLPTAFAGDNLRHRPSDFRPPLFDRPFYNSSQSSGPEFFAPPSHQPPFLHEEVIDRESFRKRMRMEDPEIGVFPPFHPLNRALSLDDERRLNLIRDHGREGTTLVHEERHWNNNRDFRMDQDDRDVLRKHFGSSGIDHGLSESEIYHRDGHYQAKGCEGYPNQQIHSLNGDERRDFERMEFGPDRRGLFDPQLGVGYPNGLNAQLDRNSHFPRFRGSDDALGGSQNFVSVLPGESSLKDSWRPASYSNNDDITSSVRNFHDQQQNLYSTNNYNPLRVGNFHDQQDAHSMPSSYPLLPKQPSHLHTDDYVTAPSHQDHATQNYMESKSEFYKQKGEMLRNCLDHFHPVPGQVQKPLDSQFYPAVEQLGPHTSKQAGYTPAMADVNHVMGTSVPDHGHTSQAYPSIPPQPLFPVANHAMGTSIPDHAHTSQSYPPIPPPPLFPIETDTSLSSLQTSSAPAVISVVSPIGVNTSAKRLLSVCGSQSLPQGEFYSDPSVQASNGFAIEGSPFIHQPLSNLDERGPSFLLKHCLKEKPAYVDAAHLFKQPYRASRPNHIVIILRGLPGSGKSYLAKAIRDIEVENGGNAPRIHAMDDYFMIEVEKNVEDTEGLKSSGSVRSKKQITKKVIEYCYEPEMEEAYRSSMLKAFKKTIDDGIFTFVIVDDRNLRVADFAQFWAIAKRSGYEVYLLEATYKDPAGCAARNIHGFKLADIQKMAEQWEEAPPLYLHLDVQSLLGGDDLIDQSIQEVDMDADDTAGDREAHHSQETADCNSTELKSYDQESDHGSTKLGKRWSTEEEEVVPDKKELQNSRWSKDPQQHDSKSAVGTTSALSGLIQAYGKGVNAVHWGDKVEISGFSIGASKRQSPSSLIIGPGAGYNLKSNPLPEDSAVAEEGAGKTNSETKKRFNEQLRAERESFRAVFDRRRHRVSGLLNADGE